MNIAQRCLEHYQSDDFKADYAFMLLDDTERCYSRIQRVAESYDIRLTDLQIKLIFEHLRNNTEEYISDFCSYYVGYDCIDSVSFGEQEVQLEGINNHRTGMPYTNRYLRYIFTREGFTINIGHFHTCAYYDMSSQGLRITLNGDQINEILSKI